MFISILSLKQQAICVPSMVIQRFATSTSKRRAFEKRDHAGQLVLLHVGNLVVLFEHLNKGWGAGCLGNVLWWIPAAI